MRNDLRNWIEEVKALGDLQVVEGAHWNLEMGCLTNLNVKRLGRDHPALLFDCITDYPAGYRVLTCMTSARNRIALTVNAEPCSNDQAFVELLAGKFQEWEKNLGDFEPLTVTSGPVMEEVHQDDQVNLYEFPSPLGNYLDGGRFIGSADVVITRDPDTGEINLGTYRMMVQDEKTAGLFIVPGQHASLHVQKWHERGAACPVAVSVGHHPAMFLVAATELPAACEYQYAGAILGEPVEVIIDEETGLPIPADSEIVFVGWCPPGKTRAEGPFAEWTGYYGSPLKEPAPIVEVKRIYHRRDPILLACIHGIPPHDTSYFSALRRSALLHHELLQSGVPDVKGAWVSEIGGRQLMVISVKQHYAGHAKQAALIASQNRVGSNMGRYVIVVDEDIDPTNAQEVLWALCTRSDPERDIDILRNCRSNALDPILPKPASAYVNSRAIIDATMPFHWKEKFPIPVRFNRDYEEEMALKWRQLFESAAGGRQTGQPGAF